MHNSIQKICHPYRMAKERHPSYFSTEGSAAKARMSSIPPRIQRGIDSGTFPIERLNRQKKTNFIWDFLEKKPDLPAELAKLYSPHGPSGGHHWGLYVLAQIEEYNCLPTEIKNTVTNYLLAFIRNNTTPVTEHGDKKYKLPTSDAIRRKLFEEVMKAANTYEDHPHTPDDYPERINFWFHQTTLFHYSIYQKLPGEIKKDITPNVVAFIRFHEEIDDEELEFEIITYALDWIKRKSANDNLLEPLPLKALQKWRSALLQSPVSIRLMRNAHFERIDDLLMNE